MRRIPKAFEGSDAAPLALRLKWLLRIVALGWLVFAVQHVLTGYYAMAAGDVFAVVATSAARWWALRTGDPRRLETGAHLAIVVSCAGIVFVSMLSGQGAAMATWYLTAIPLVAAYAIGTAAAVTWTVVACALMVGVYLSPHIVVVVPSYIPNEETWLMGRFILIAVLLGLAVAARRATDQSMAMLAEREQVIRERAAELAEARDEALAAARAKDQFLANMSHEIRTPLNGIIGMTSVLLDADQPEDQREMVKTIQRSSTALLAVLNEILDYSKLEASAVTLEKIPFDVRECVEDATDLLARSAFEKDLDLYVKMDREVPQWVEGDITYLRQVLLNLIGNAIKFTDAGEVAVLVSAPEPGRLHFRVRDTGIGISKQKHALLFRSFSQVDTSTARRYGGTGLGLAISKRLVELMDGRIWVESAEGAGSTFHFEIAAPTAEAPARPLSTHERVATIGRKLMIVGGKPGSVDAMRAVLAGEWGLEVTVAESSEVSEKVAEVSPHVIVTFAAGLDAVLALPERPPTIVMLTVADTAARERAKAGNVEAMVFRPCRQRMFRQALDAVLAGDPVASPGSFSSFDPTMGARLPARILIGEDNPVNQRVAMTVLDKLGYAPDVVPSGPEVLAAMRRREYDILFLDLQMPGMDGLETTRRIRRLTTRQPWVVALTASVGSDQRQAATKAGMDDFVGKPYDVQTLMFAIEKWARSRGLLDEEPEAEAATAQESSPWEQMRAMFARSPEKLVELIQHHLANGAALVAAIEDALTAGDTAKVAVNAHSLKSSAAQFGSDRVSALAAELEAAAKSGESGLAERAKQLALAWKTADARLSTEAAELGRDAAV